MARTSADQELSAQPLCPVKTPLKREGASALRKAEEKGESALREFVTC